MVRAPTGFLLDLRDIQQSQGRCVETRLPAQPLGKLSQKDEEFQAKLGYHTLTKNKESNSSHEWNCSPGSLLPEGTKDCSLIQTHNENEFLKL